MCLSSASELTSVSPSLLLRVHQVWEAWHARVTDRGMQAFLYQGECARSRYFVRMTCLLCCVVASHICSHVMFLSGAARYADPILRMSLEFPILARTYSYGAPAWVSDTAQHSTAQHSKQAHHQHTMCIVYRHVCLCVVSSASSRILVLCDSGLSVSCRDQHLCTHTVCDARCDSSVTMDTEGSV